MSEQIIAPKGLAGVVVDDTSISKVNPETNSLLYRGYPVQDLAEQCSFLETAYLLIEGELPNKNQLNKFEGDVLSRQKESIILKDIITKLPKYTHPMDAIRTCLSIIGCEDQRIWENDRETVKDKFITLLALIPYCVAANFRAKNELSIISPLNGENYISNFFYMCFGKVPSASIQKAFEVSLVLYAEHSFNASTFTTRVITSTQSDYHSAITGAIGSLKGPLHGGANEQVMYVMQEVDQPENAEKWLNNALAEKRKIMGFGHRVYRNGDSRVPTMKKYAQLVAKEMNEPKWMQIYDVLEKLMIEKKNIHPNLDFPSGPAYHMMGFDIDLFTPIFVMSRIAGWTAHYIEQSENNRIIRPLSKYIGSNQREVIPLNGRK